MKNTNIDSLIRRSWPSYLSMHILISAIALVMLVLVVTDILPSAVSSVLPSENRDGDFAELLLGAPPLFAPTSADAKNSSSAPR